MAKPNRIHGSSRADQIDGTAGNDEISGGTRAHPERDHGDDTLGGLGGDDLLMGLGGDDSLSGGDGVDTLGGGDGDDVLDLGTTVVEGRLAATTESVLGGAGDDTILGSSTHDTSFPYFSRDVLSGGDGNDRIEIRSAATGADTARGDAGNDTLLAGAGAQSLDGGTGRDSLSAGAGNDSLAGGDDRDSLWGGDNNDSVVGDAGRDALWGEDANDLLDGGAGRDSVSGGTLNDILSGGEGHDSLSGDSENDSLDGGAGRDSLAGGAGNDILRGGEGRDLLVGGSGNDLFFADGPHDRVVELDGAAGGLDTVFASTNYRLKPNFEGLVLVGRGEIHGTGRAGAESLFGNNDATLLLGKGGADTVDGGRGDADDTLVGGHGADALRGRHGSDIFQYGSARDGRDRIEKYEGVEDQIIVSAAGFGGGLVAGMDVVATGHYAENATGTATAATGQFLVDSDKNKVHLYWDADGTGAGRAVLVAEFVSGTGWAGTEITVIA